MSVDALRRAPVYTEIRAGVQHQVLAFLDHDMQMAILRQRRPSTELRRVGPGDQHIGRWLLSRGAAPQQPRETHTHQPQPDALAHEPTHGNATFLSLWFGRYCK